MPILDKLMLGRIDEDGLKKLAAFVEDFSSEVRGTHGDAIRGGVKAPNREATAQFKSYVEGWPSEP